MCTHIYVYLFNQCECDVMYNIRINNTSRQYII